MFIRWTISLIPGARSSDSPRAASTVVSPSTLPPVLFEIRVAEPPSGYYWVAGGPRSLEALSIGPDEPLIHQDFRVRKGTIWTFQFTRGPQRQPCAGFVSGESKILWEAFAAHADDTGRLQLPLPAEEREVALAVRESSGESAELDTGSLYLRLKWDLGFRPNEVKQIALEDQVGPAFHLIGDNNNTASLTSPGSQIEPVIDNGRLVIRVMMPVRGALDLGAVTGQVLDDRDRPVPGARVGLAASGDFVSNELRHQSTTNAEGRYRLRDIPRREIHGEPLAFQIVVVKDGYAGQVSPPQTLKEDTSPRYQVLDPIRLTPGIAISGTVIDHRGQPVAGARVLSSRPLRYRGLSARSQTARTDDDGRFTLHDLERGLTQLTASDAFVIGGPSDVRVGIAQSVLLQLPKPRR